MILKFNKIETLNIFKQIIVFFNIFDPLINLNFYYENDHLFYEDLNNINVHKLQLSKNLFSEINTDDNNRIIIPNALVLLELKLLKKTKKRFPNITFYNIEKNGILFMIIETYLNNEKTMVEIPLVKDKSDKIYIIKYNYLIEPYYRFSFSINKINNLIFSSVILNKLCSLQLLKNRIILKFFCSNNIIKTYETCSKDTLVLNKNYLNDENFILFFDSSFLKNIIKIFDKKDNFNIIYTKGSNFIFIELKLNNDDFCIVFKVECYQNLNINSGDIEIKKIYDLINS
jgi:hypothetical protein